MKKISLYFVFIAFLAMLFACGNNNKSAETAEVVYCSDVVEIKNTYHLTDDVYVFKVGSRFGVKNTKGDILLPPEFGKVIHYGLSESSDEELAFWRGSDSIDVNSFPDAEIFCDYLNLVVRNDALSGIYSKAGEVLLPLEYKEIHFMSVAGSYVIENNEKSEISIWKDGKFILNSENRDFYGTDINKNKYVFSDKKGTCWYFYDFDGTNKQCLKLKSVPKGVSLPQFLQKGYFLVDNSLVNEKGKILKTFPEWTEVCGNFLVVPETRNNHERYSVFFGNGKKLEEQADKVYAVVTEKKPHLPTGKIVIEKEGSLWLYDNFGNRERKVIGISNIWLFADFEPTDTIPVYSEY